MNTIMLLFAGYVTIDEHNDIIDYRLCDYNDGPTHDHIATRHYTVPTEQVPL